MANSKGVLPLRVTSVFLTVAALRINWAGVTCDRVVWSRFLEAKNAQVCCPLLELCNRHVVVSQVKIPQVSRIGQLIRDPAESFTV